MDTRFLESFVFVADHGSMAEAARRLNLTPAALAQRIRALERDIGSPLLVRAGRTVTPTEAGARVLARARAFLQSARDLRAAAVDDRTAGELHAGSVATAMTGLVPDILARLAKSHPRVRVRVSPGGSGDLYEKVNRGELDAAIVVKPEFALAKACEWRPLRAEPLLVIAPVALRERDPNALLAREPFIRLSRDTAGGRLVDRYLRREGILPQERFEVTSLFAITRMVDRGLGVALIPDWPPPWPEGVRLRRIPVDSPEHARQVGVVYPRASVRAGPVQAFVEAATAVAAGTLSRP
ncbi:MAG: LysR family transcriptional regulator [Betaproteobacteria bacterium]|nr:LysR family transcriptional regulator [Betaproteobacteria bacterium]